MKSIIFDTGPIISLATNNLLWILEPLRQEFKGSFYITDAVKRELIDKPLDTKKFKFEAIQVQKLIDDGILEIIDSKRINQVALDFLNLANQTFKAYDNYIKLVHYAEMSVIAAAIDQNSAAIAIDEKTTRHLIEDPIFIRNLMEKTLHTNIIINEENLRQFLQKTAGIRTIRSVELVAVAYENGILDRFITKIPNARKILLESVLWGVKLNGCAVSQEEIDQIIRLEK